MRKGMEPEPDPCRWLMNPYLGGPKTCGSGSGSGSGFPTLIISIGTAAFNWGQGYRSAMKKKWLKFNLGMWAGGAVWSRSQSDPDGERSRGAAHRHAGGRRLGEEWPGTARTQVSGSLYWVLVPTLLVSWEKGGMYATGNPELSFKDGASDMGWIRIQFGLWIRI